MIATAEFIANSRKGSFRVFATQVHGDLARQRDVLSSPFRFQIAEPNIKIITDRFLNVFNSYLSLGAL
jgi:hypothetical protein